MLSLSKGLLFVWEAADSVIPCHAPHFPKLGEKNFSKKSVVMDQKILKGVQGSLIENRKLHICIIINN